MQHTTATDDSVISVSSLGMNDDSGRPSTLIETCNCLHAQNAKPNGASTASEENAALIDDMQIC